MRDPSECVFGRSISISDRTASCTSKRTARSPMVKSSPPSTRLATTECASLVWLLSGEPHNDCTVTVLAVPIPRRLPNGRHRSPPPDTLKDIDAVAIHVVLVHPEIHWNTGNAGRTCLATGSALDLIEPARFFPRRPASQASRARLLGVCRPAPMAELGRVRKGTAVSRRTVLLFDQGHAPLLGRAARRVTRRRARFRARKQDCRATCTSGIATGSSECRWNRRTCGRSTCPQVSRSRYTKCNGSVVWPARDGDSPVAL